MADTMLAGALVTSNPVMALAPSVSGRPGDDAQVKGQLDAEGRFVPSSLPSNGSRRARIHSYDYGR